MRSKLWGYLPKADPFVLESRHLGLVTPQELQGLKSTDATGMRGKRDVGSGRNQWILIATERAEELKSRKIGRIRKMEV